MRSVTRPGRRGPILARSPHSRRQRRTAALPAAALLAAALALSAAAPAVPAAAAQETAAAVIGGGCNYHQIAGGYQWVCTDTGTAPGAQGSGGSAAEPACTLTPLTQQQAAVLGLPSPPAGQAWDLVGCGGAQPFVGTMLVATTPAGAPAVTPQQLAQIAVGDLVIPGLDPDTAPPAGQDGLVGLPEWFWVPPAEWHQVQTPPVRAGPVWAVATATPETIVFSPGGGLAGVSCQGPGPAYNPGLPSAAQHTDCSYTYDQPSVGQPGNAYAADVTILWNVSWVGSGGTGGTVAAGRPVATPLTLPVAAGEALVTGG
jgi:hypothetical protein